MANLENWWHELTREQHDAFLTLHNGDPLPAHLAALAAHAPTQGASVEWLTQPDSDGSVVHQELGHFLDDKRTASGQTASAGT